MPTAAVPANDADFSAVPHVPEFAFDPTDPWTETFQEGLMRADLSGKRVYEVGIGTGMNAVFLLRSLEAARVSGSDLDPRLAELATKNVQELAPGDVERFSPVRGAVSLLDADAARSEVAQTDTVIACLPQVACPQDQKFAAIRDSHDVEVPEEVQERRVDHLAHYYPWQDFSAFPFNAVGLGLNEALLRQVRETSGEAELIMNFGARIPRANIMEMFEANGYAPEILHSRIVEQDAGTDISFFVTLEKAAEESQLERDLVCDFYADLEGKEALSAQEAQERQEATPDLPICHEVCVIRAEPC